MKYEITDTLSSMLIFTGWIFSSVANIGDSKEPGNILLFALSVISIGLGILIII